MARLASGASRYPLAKIQSEPTRSIIKRLAWNRHVGPRRIGRMKRVVTNAVKRLLARAFALGQRLGVDILPRHFYSEVPDLRKLRRTAHWRKPFSMIGVNGADPDEQLAFVRSLLPDD